MRPLPRFLRRLAGVASAAAGLAATACSSTATSPLPAVASQSVKVGQEVNPEGLAVFYLSLIAVEADSRCPSTLICVWAGDATARFGYRFGRGPTIPLRLNLNTPPRDTVVGDIRIVFDSLTPYPTVAGPLLPQDQYRAWVTMRLPR